MTLTSLAPDAVFRGVDGNGNPLSGGKLFQYAAGTTTKLATYTDSTGATQNTNPIILNSRGECNLWLAQSIPYKLVLSPSTDSDPPSTPFWTVDNVTSVPSGNTVNSVPVTVVTIGSTYSVQLLDYVVVVNKASGSATAVTLPSGPNQGRAVVIKDGKGDAATNNITVTPASGNIDGASSYVIRTNHGGIIAVYDGTQWELESFDAQSANAFVYAGNPNGYVAGNAGTAGALPPDMCWDTTNGQWWICTTTGNAAAAVWSTEKLVGRTLSGTTTATGTLDASGATTIKLGGTITDSGTTTKTGTLDASGATTIKLGGTVTDTANTTNTGTLNATGATVTVATQTAGDNSTKAASTAYADNSSAAAAAASVPGYLLLNSGII